jgi:hypothetical protein
MTPRERLALQRAAEDFKASEPSIPTDFTTDMPTEGLIWLTKGGLHLEDIKRYGFGYSPSIKRVILPCWNSDGALTCIQARNTGSAHGPKYLSQVWSGERPVWSSLCGHGGDRGTVLGEPVCQTLVLTEDILSAARVSKVGVDVWSLLGTNLMPAVLNRIGEAQYTDVAVWMDPDEAGIKARRKMLRQLGAVGINARPITSDRDPKMHTLEEIKELIR